MFVKNLSRKEAATQEPEDNSVWISIREPKEVHPGWDATPLFSPLRKLPTLDLAFWDVERISEIHILDQETGLFGPFTLHLPTKKDMDDLYDFILRNVGKNFYINCRAGISRSAAIAEFIAWVWKYDWPAEYQQRADPNKYILNELKLRWGKDL